VGNPTGAILGYLDLLSKGGLAEAEKAECLEEGGERGRANPTDRAGASGIFPASPRLEEGVDVNEVIDRALSLLSHQKKVWEQIHVVREFQGDLPCWKGNPHHLQQVMINLLLNAARCPGLDRRGPGPGEKKIRITTRALSPEELADSFGPGRRRRKEDAPGRNSSLFRIPGIPTRCPRRK